MPSIASRNLSLLALRTATGAASASLRACAGTTAQSGIGDFALGAVGQITGPATVAPGETATYALSFSDFGPRFHRIFENENNLIWTLVGSGAVLGAKLNQTVQVTFNSTGNFTLRARLRDGFNGAASGYDTDRSLAITCTPSVVLMSLSVVRLQGSTPVAVSGVTLTHTATTNGRSSTVSSTSPVNASWNVGQSVSVTAPATINAGGAQHQFSHWTRPFSANVYTTTMTFTVPAAGVPLTAVYSAAA